MKILLIWEEVPDRIFMFELEMDSELGQKFLKLHNRFINLDSGEEQEQLCEEYIYPIVAEARKSVMKNTFKSVRWEYLTDPRPINVDAFISSGIML